MFFKYWPVLLVDDEPDVLAVSRLAMKNFEVFGLPLKIYTAGSKEEAVQLIKDDVEVGCSLAVAMLDSCTSWYSESGGCYREGEKEDKGRRKEV